MEEAFELYGFDKSELDRKSTWQNASDVDSVITEDTVPLPDRVNSRLYMVRETEFGRVLWRCALEESDTIAHHFDSTQTLRHRLPCQSFRSMLVPVKQDQNPTFQNPHWLRTCMRGLFFASWRSFNDHAVSDSIERFRFPEMAYCWFSSQGEIAHDDDDKWSFYFGVKHLAKSDPEGWIIYQLIDDMQGEYVISFLYHTMDTIKKHATSTLKDELDLFASKDAVTSKSKLHGTLESSALVFDESYPIYGRFMLPMEGVIVVVNELFDDDSIKSSETIEMLHKQLKNWQVVSSRGQSVELFTLVQLTMKAYIGHMKQLSTMIRLMFETHSRGILTDFYDEPHDRGIKDDSPICGECSVGLIDVHKILTTLWPEISLKETTLLYREAYDNLYPPSRWGEPSPDGISYISFMAAADKRCLFSRIRRGQRCDEW